MARGTTLTAALVMLKNKIKANITLGQSTSDDNTLMMDISRYQLQLCNKLDWPFLRERWDIATILNGRYYNFPTVDEAKTTVAINFQRPIHVYVWWANAWLGPIPSGISQEEYNQRNSDGSPPDSGNPPETLDPIQRWDYNDQTQFEVWPVPASASFIRFEGQRVPDPLFNLATVAPVANATLDLDDELVTLFAAGEILAEMQSAKAGLMQQAAASLMAFLTATTPKRTKPCGFGKRPDSLPNRLIPVRKNIAVA
jgi:hypothetical protein